MKKKMRKQNRNVLRTVWTAIILSLSLAFAGSLASAAEPVPLEFQDIPVNGTDIIEDPAAIRANYGFRLANKVVEQGDTITLQESFTALETPHIKWAAPYARGALRVLVIASGRNIRNGIEIQQRSNFEVTTLILPGFLSEDNMPDADPAGAAFFDEKFKKLMARDYDVILLPSQTQLFWTRHGNPVPALERVLNGIESKVKSGTGLVLLQSRAQWWRTPKEKLSIEHALSPVSYAKGQGATGIPARAKTVSSLSSAFSFVLWPHTSVYNSSLDKEAQLLVSVGGKPMVASGTYGRGRVVSVRAETAHHLVPAFDPIATPRFDDYWEPVYAFYLKALAWAADLEPEVALSVPEVTVAKAGDAPVVRIGLTSATGKPRKLRLRYSFRDERTTTIKTGRVSARAGAKPTTLDITLPACEANGLYRLDLWLVDGKHVVDWGSAAVRVTDGVELNVESLTEMAKPDGGVRYKVSAPGVTGMLTVRGVDDMERVFAEQTVKFQNNTGVELDLARSCMPGNRIEFTLSDGKNILARRILRLYIPRIGLGSTDDEFVIASYGFTPVEQHLRAHLGGLYREAGMNALYNNWHNRNYIAPAADAGLVCMTGASWAAREKSLKKELSQCPNNPDVLAKRKKLIDEAKDDTRAYGGISRVLDDETWFCYTTYKDGEMLGQQACQCEHCLRLFREAMEKRYGDIAKLNDTWETDFASFADVRVIEEDEIKNTDNPSGWLEFRQFMNQTYADYYGWVTEQHRDLAPDYYAGCGAPHWTTQEGGPTYRGGDFSKLKNTMRFLMAYGGAELLQFPDAFVGQPGGQKYDPPLAWTNFGSWRHLLNGADALWYYYGKALIGSELAWRKHAEWILEGVQDIRDGMGILVSRAQPLNRQVRILYSSENMAMGWLLNKREDGWNALGGGNPITAGTLKSVLGNLFYLQSSTVYADDIRNGDLHDCKLLVLPRILNIDDETAGAIKDYVRNGGYVLADVMPGTRGQFGKLREKGAFDDLFGVDTSKAVIHNERNIWYSIGLKFGVDDTSWPGQAAWLPGKTWFLGLEPTTAKPQGQAYSKEGKEAPICFLNDFGEGKALLLNFLYCNLNTDTAAWHKLFGEGLLIWADLEPVARIVSPKTNVPLSNRPLRAFRRGKATLLGCIRGNMIWSGGKPILVDESRALDFSDAAKFVWQGKQHAYNVRDGKYYGFVNSAELDLPSFRGRLLALLPYKVENIDVKAPDSAKAGEMVTVKAQVMTSNAEPGEHVFRMKVYSPTGYENLIYCKTRTGAAGAAEFQIPFANNDRPGNWEIVVRDVMTGTEQTHKIRLR